MHDADGLTYAWRNQFFRKHMKVNQELPLPERTLTPKLGVTNLPQTQVLSVAAFAGQLDVADTNNSLRIRQPKEGTANTT